MRADEDRSLGEASLYPYWVDIKPLHSDVDFNDHINHIAVMRYFEHARVAEFRPQLEALEHCALVLAKLDMVFWSETRFRPSLAVGTRLLGTGRSSLKIVQGLFDDTLCTAAMRTVVVKIDTRTKTSIALTDSDLRIFDKLTLGTTQANGAGGDQ